MRVEIYNTLNEWNEANNLAHETLVKLKGYNSLKYTESPLVSTENKFLLPELPKFANELKAVGFNFIELDLSIIKQNEL